jgi:hypothetical protein
MSRVLGLQLLLIGLGGAALPVAVRVLQPANSGALPISSRPAPVRNGHGPASSRRSLDSLVRAAVARAAFRVSRRPTAVAYDPDHVPGAALPVQPVAHPVLTVSGIVWGRGLEPTVVLEGLPGVEGPRVVHVGESVGGLKVRQIRDGAVVVTGLDTAWTLHVREPWR